MKIIFLDIDGVLNTTNHIGRRFRSKEITTHEDWCPIACKGLNKIISQSPGKTGIVLSSTWRLGRSRAEIIGLFERNNINGRLVDTTPANPNFFPGHSGRTRGAEIRQWLIRNTTPRGVDRYVIIDDDSDMLPKQRPYFVHCDHRRGLADPQKVEKAIKILSDGNT